MLLRAMTRNDHLREFLCGQRYDREQGIYAYNVLDEMWNSIPVLRAADRELDEARTRADALQAAVHARAACVDAATQTAVCGRSAFSSGFRDSYLIRLHAVSVHVETYGKKHV